MNAAHWHLAMNHIPVVGAFFATGLLALALWRRSDELIRVCFGVVVAVAALTVPVYFTGEPTENVLMDVPDFAEELVKPHQQAAGVAFTAIVLVGLAALGGLIFFRKSAPFPRWFAVSVFGLTLVTSGLVSWTANLGGRIRHPEVRPAGATTPPPKAEGE
ncbi:MAG: hypothetical protein QOE70_872 [Chthoniobacter sp.]|jgi:hypothetical protein|nr:hypothetical protein [Chthoniobacter sp.]